MRISDWSSDVCSSDLPEQERVRLERRAQQDVVPVARGHEGDDLLVVVAGQEPFADQDPQIMGQRRVRLVDSLVLADEASETLRDLPRPGFECRIGETFGRVDGARRERMRTRLTYSH